MAVNWWPLQSGERRAGLTAAAAGPAGLRRQARAQCPAGAQSAVKQWTALLNAAAGGAANVPNPNLQRLTFHFKLDISPRIRSFTEYLY